jgi:hypothetical protein
METGSIRPIDEELALIHAMLANEVLRRSIPPGRDCRRNEGKSVELRRPPANFLLTGLNRLVQCSSDRAGLEEAIIGP